MTEELPRTEQYKCDVLSSSEVLRKYPRGAAISTILNKK